MYLLPIVVLAEEIAVPIDHGIDVSPRASGAGRLPGGRVDPVARVAQRNSRGACQ